MQTVGEIVEEIGWLLSEVAVWETIGNHLQSLYVPGDDGQPEMRMYREDGGLVPDAHIQKMLATLQEQIREAGAKIDTLRGQPLGAAEDNVVPLFGLKEVAEVENEEDQEADDEDGSPFKT